MKNNYKSLSDTLSFWHFDDNLMVFSDGSLGGGFKLKGLDITCLTNSEINNFSSAIENLLVLCEEGLRLQIFYRLGSNVSEIIKKHEEIFIDSDKIYRPIFKARHDFLLKNEKMNNFYHPEIYFFVRGQSFNNSKRRFWEIEAKYKKHVFSLYEKHKNKFLRSFKQIESSLKHAKLEPARLDNKTWFKLIFEYLNFSRSENYDVPTLREMNDVFSPPLIDQLCLSDIAIEKDKIKIGDYYFRVITLKTLPEGSTYASMIDEFTKLPFHFWISQNINILNQSKELDRLGLQRKITHSMASGNQKISDIESESKLAQIEELLNELTEGSEKLVTTDFNVIIWSKNKRELEEKSDEVLKAFKQLNQSEGLVETYPAFEVFIKSVPGCGEGLRHKKVKSSNAAHLAPLFGTWTGNKKPVCLLPNRENNLFSIDPFAPELPNWNGLIFGGSGAGKSFTISQLMLMFCGQKPKPKIIWIDNGASSQRLLEIFNGEFIDLTLDSGIRLNMFDLEDGELKPTPSKIKLILGILEVILKDEDKKGLPKREKALIEEAIFNVYENVKPNVPTLSDLKQILNNHKSIEMKKYAEILYSWTGSTAFGKMLDGESNVKLTKDLVTIEIRGLDNYKDLKDIFLLLFTSFIKDEAAKDLSRPYLLIIDEAARLFLTPSGKDFAIECYRVFRKYNAGIWCISQNYRDFLSDQELADALMPNTTSVFILRQKKIDWKDFQNAFDFNDAQVEAIKSIEIVKGEYSEFFYMQDEKQTILRLVPEPLSYWICTTDGNDKAKIAEMERKYPELSKIDISTKLSKT